MTVAWYSGMRDVPLALLGIPPGGWDEYVADAAAESRASLDRPAARQPDISEVRSASAARPMPAERRSLARVADAIVSEQATTPADIRTLPAVTGARRLIASTIDQLPVVVERNGQAVDAPEWLHSPRKYNGTSDAGDIVQYLVDSMVLHGRGFLWCRSVSDDGAWRLDPIDPQFVTPSHPANGLMGSTFKWTGDGTSESWTPQVPYSLTSVRKGEGFLLHVPYVVTVEHPEGTTPLTESAPVLRGLLATERHVAEMFASGNTWVGGVLTTPQEIARDQAIEAGDTFMARRVEGRIPVLGNGLQYVNEVPSAQDLQMVEARSFNQSVVWAMLGIPQAYMGSSLMGGQSSLSYANAQDNRRQFADNCLRAFTTQIEDALSRLLPHGRGPGEDVTARFDYSEWEGRADDGAQNTAPVSVPSA